MTLEWRPGWRQLTVPLTLYGVALFALLLFAWTAAAALLVLMIVVCSSVDTLACTARHGKNVRLWLPRAEPDSEDAVPADSVVLRRVLWSVPGCAVVEVSGPGGKRRLSVFQQEMNPDDYACLKRWVMRRLNPRRAAARPAGR